MQSQFYAGNKLDSSAKAMVQNINSIIEKFNPENVIYIKSTGKALGISAKGFSIDTLPAPKLDSNLKIVSQNIFTKISGDAFEVAELNNFLKNNKRLFKIHLLILLCINLIIES